MSRLRSNFQRGSLSANIGSSDTTLTSNEFTTLPVVASPDYLMVVLDPDAAHGNPEIVKVTTHTAAASTVSVTRAQESTTARAHNSSTTWRHVPTVIDWGPLSGSVWFNVTDPVYGAKGNGTTNDSAAIQAAVDAASASGLRAVVFFPPGTYSVPSGINCNDKPVTLMGANDRGTFLVGNGTTTYVVSHQNTSDTTGFTLEGLSISHSPASASRDGVVITNTSLATIRRCSFAYCNKGLNLNTNARVSVVDGCTFGSTNQYGLALGSGANSNRIVGNWFDENVVGGLYCNGSYNAITGNTFQDNTSTHVFLDTAASANVITGSTFRVGSGGTATASVASIYGTYNVLAYNITDHTATNSIFLQASSSYNAIGPWTIVGQVAANPFVADAGTHNTWVTWADGNLTAPATFNATPAGAPLNYQAGVAFHFDTFTNKLWAYNGSAWKSVTLT